MAIEKVKFKRAMVPFSEVARARLCTSNGSEHSGEGSGEVEDFMESFLIRYVEEETMDEDIEDEKFGSRRETNDGTRERLESLFRCDLSAEKIRGKTERACRKIGTVSDGTEFKRLLMSRLRERRLDAGLCKSRWEKTSQFPSGSYEYIDAWYNQERYIVEVGLANEFQIARPTTKYLALLNAFPPVFVGRPETLRAVVGLMCPAAKESLKSNYLHFPPWRRTRYMNGKWFGSYKRTTNSISTHREKVVVSTIKQVPRFDFKVGVHELANCNKEYVKMRRDSKVGYLAAALNCA